MKTVDGFRKVPSVAFDTTNNGSSNPWKSTRFTRSVVECLKAAPSTHSRKNRLLLAIFSNFTNSGGIKYPLMIA